MSMLATSVGEGPRDESVDEATRPSTRSAPDREHAAERTWVRRTIGAVVGLVGGGLVGLYGTMAVFVAKARAGRYLFSIDDLADVRWEAIPLGLGLVAGTWIGLKDPSFLTRIGARMGVLGLALLLPGWAVGDVIWRGDSGPWAGAVLASALGAVAGIVWAWLRRPRSES